MLNREREVPVKEKKNLLHDCGVLILYALHSYAFASKGMTIGIFKDGFPGAHLTTGECIEGDINLRPLFCFHRCRSGDCWSRGTREVHLGRGATSRSRPQKILASRQIKPNIIRVKQIKSG